RVAADHSLRTGDPPDRADNAIRPQGAVRGRALRRHRGHGPAYRPRAGRRALRARLAGTLRLPAPLAPARSRDLGQPLHDARGDAVAVERIPPRHAPHHGQRGRTGNLGLRVDGTGGRLILPELPREASLTSRWFPAPWPRETRSLG